MVYTSFDMVQDCRADRPAGWAYFITNYVPAIRALIGHYRPKADAPIDAVLLELRKPESNLFAALEPSPERVFVTELRQYVLRALDKIAPWPQPDIAIDLEILTKALELFTFVEKQAVWLETMGYAPAGTGTMMRVSETTVEKIRQRAAERIRANTDSWRQTLLVENGRELGRAAEPASGECTAPKAFLDIIEGRMTWSGREELDRHVTRCWHCVDHFCRILEAAELVRSLEPLTEQEGEPFRKLLGVTEQKRPVWKRLFSTS